jgi:hypothetical protein
VVERYWQVQAHVPEDFWTINCHYSSEEGNANFSWAYSSLPFLDYFYFVVSKDQTDMQERRILLSRSQKDNKPIRISFSNVHIKPRELME